MPNKRFTLEELLNTPEEPVTADSKIGELEVTVLAYNALRNAGIATIGDLISHTPQEIRAIRNIGKSGFDSIKSGLDRYGFSWSTQ